MIKKIVNLDKEIQHIEKSLVVLRLMLMGFFVEENKAKTMSDKKKNDTKSNIQNKKYEQ